MEQIWSIIQEMIADKREHEEAEAAEKACRDLVYQIRSVESKVREKWYAEGYSKGYPEGYAKGYAEGFVEDVEKGTLSRLFYMLGQGRSAKEISAFTGLPVENVLFVVEKISKMQWIFSGVRQ